MGLGSIETSLEAVRPDAFPSASRGPRALSLEASRSLPPVLLEWWCCKFHETAQLSVIFRHYQLARLRDHHSRALRTFSGQFRRSLDEGAGGGIGRRRLTKSRGCLHSGGTAVLEG